MSLENKGSIAAKVLVTSEPDRSGNRICNGTSDETEINLAFIDLTSGRTGKEAVKLIGDFTIDGPILIPSLTVLDLREATIHLANSSDCDMIENSDQVNGNDDIEIIGGWLDGNSVNQGVGTWHGIHLVRPTHCRIHDVRVDDCDSRGIYLEGLNQTDQQAWRCEVSFCTVTNCDYGYSFRYATQIRIEGNCGFECVTACFHFYRMVYSNIVNNTARSNTHTNTCYGFYGEYGGPENQFIGNEGSDLWYGLWIQTSTSWAIVGNQFNGCYRGGIVLYNNCNYCIVDANQVPDSVSGDPNGTYDAIDINGEHNIISHNNMHFISGWVCRHGIRIRQHHNVVHGNVIDGPGTHGIYIYGADYTIVTDNRILNAGYSGAGNAIDIANDSDYCWIEGNMTSGSATGCVSVANGCDYNDFSAGNTFHERGFVNSATTTIFPSEPFQFIKEIVGVWLTTSPTGIEVDADTEGAICLGHLPRYVRQVMRLRIWAVALDAPIGGGGQMHAEFTFNAAAGNEAYNLAANSWVLANHDSEEADYVANDVIQWVIEDADVGTELSNLLGGDKFELIVMHEAGADPDGATDAVFGSMEVEYV